MKKIEQARANDNGPSPQVQSQTVQPQTVCDPVKTAGFPTGENEWFSIGLSKVEVAMLKNIQARIWIVPETSTRAETIHILLLAALAHYGTLANVLFADADYCKHEGFDGYLAFFERMIEAKLDKSSAALAAIRAAHASRSPASTQAGKGGAK